MVKIIFKVNFTVIQLLIPLTVPNKSLQKHQIAGDLIAHKRPSAAASLLIVRILYFSHTIVSYIVKIRQPAANGDVVQHAAGGDDGANLVRVRESDLAVENVEAPLKTAKCLLDTYALLRMVLVEAPLSAVARRSIVWRQQIRLACIASVAHQRAPNPASLKVPEDG